MVKQRSAGRKKEKEEDWVRCLAWVGLPHLVEKCMMENLLPKAACRQSAGLYIFGDEALFFGNYTLTEFFILLRVAAIRSISCWGRLQQESDSKELQVLVFHHFPSKFLDVCQKSSIPQSFAPPLNCNLKGDQQSCSKFRTSFLYLYSSFHR